MTEYYVAAYAFAGVVLVWLVVTVLIIQWWEDS